MPSSDDIDDAKLTNPTQVEMARSFENLIERIGEDVERPGLADTPARAAKAFAHLTSGYATDLDVVVNNALFPCDNDDMVVVKDVEFYSLCEHHLLPFWGRCHVGYLPRGKVIGLSKIPRLIDAFSRRLQVQEVLTRQISRAIEEYTGASGVGVIMEGRHMCMMMRGVEKQNAIMRTSSMLGAFRSNDMTRNEFLRLVDF